MPNPPPHKPAQLPRGPHTLSREAVAESQRERLFAAMIASVASRGYAQTSVADVLTQSGVSRATFYQLFADKEDCFCAAYQQAASQLALALATSLQAGTPDATPLQRLERILGLYLSQLAAQPTLARTFLVEVHAACLRAVTQRQAAIESFVDLVSATLEGQTGLQGSVEEQRFAVKVLVHGVIAMATSMIGSGDTARLPELKGPLMQLAEKLFA